MFGGFIGGYIVGLIFCIPVAFILLYLIATGLLSFAGSHIVFFTVLICGWIVTSACPCKTHEKCDTHSLPSTEESDHH